MKSGLQAALLTDLVTKKSKDSENSGLKKRAAKRLKKWNVDKGYTVKGADVFF